MKTLFQTLQEMLRHSESLNCAPRTVQGHRKNLRPFLLWLRQTWNVTTPDRLRPGHLHAYQNHLANVHKTPKGTPLKPRSVNNMVCSLRVFLRFLHQRGYLYRDLAEAISYVKEPRTLPISVLEHSEVRSIFNRIDKSTPIGYRNRTILELLYSTGIRRGELLALQTADVDLQNAALRVTGKGRKERVVPIGRTAARFLETYVKAVRPFWRGAHQTSALFLSKYGRALEANGVRWIVSHCCAQASVPVTPHTFRRSCTTELVRSNANLYHVKQMLGHESLQSLTPYTKLTINDLRKTHAKCHPRELDEKRERG